MNVEIINTGTELMQGFILNTHQQWLCQQLSNAGYAVTRQNAVPDSGEAIRQCVGEALARADVVITTGGLGPTSDDLTREMIAESLGTPLRENLEVVEHIQTFFSNRRRKMPERTRGQALVPEGATVLMNAHGTAPGLVMEIAPGRFRNAERSSWLIMLPGPPRELRPMFTEQLIPLLQRMIGLPEPFVCRVLRTTGLGESLVEDRVAAPLRNLVDSGLAIGYCAHAGFVDLRLMAKGPNAATIIEQAEQVIRPLLADQIFGVGDVSLEQVVVERLIERQKTLAVAESCTGGLIAHRLTNVPGASATFRAGLVTYSNEAKQHFLGVRAETLQIHGAVSKATAREMAEGARNRTGVDYAIAVTGIAGPGGGTVEKPVGTVFIAIASGKTTVVMKHLNPYDRETFKFVTSQQALDLLRRRLLNEA